MGIGSFQGEKRLGRADEFPSLSSAVYLYINVKICKGKVTPKQAYVALRGPGG
jgi:hypothetical protein